jgi:hypothetical protein
MAARIRMRPPQRGHAKTSRAKTRVISSDQTSEVLRLKVAAGQHAAFLPITLQPSSCARAVVFTSKQNMCRYLHMIWICLPPESGNWWRGDFHPSAHTALSATHAFLLPTLQPRPVTQPEARLATGLPATALAGLDFH